MAKAPEHLIEEALKTVLEEYGLTEDMSLKDCVEKQIAKKPIEDIENTDKVYGEAYNCPVCGENVGMYDIKNKYCPECGQKIDWEV